MSAKHLASDDCRRIVATIRGIMQRYGIALDAAPLEAELAEAEWLASFDGDVLFSAAWDPPTRARTTDAVSRVLRLKRIAWALHMASDLPGFERIVGRLRDLRIRTAAPQGDAADEGRFGQAWDTLFEVEVAAQLMGEPLSVSFEEPDIVVRFSSSDALLGLACKRPRSLQSVAGAIGSAVGQIERFPGPGAVVLSLDLLLPALHRRVLRNWIIVEHDRETAAACAQVVGSAMTDLAGAAGDVFQRAASRSPRDLADVAGILGVANLLVIAGLDGGQRYVNTKTVATLLPIVDGAYKADVLAFVRERLELGQAAFRSDEWMDEVDVPAA